MFYHSILALHDVGQDCAPFFGARNSFRKAMALSRSMPLADQQEVVPAPDMTRTALGGHLHKMAEEAGDQILDPMDYEEVHWNEGDLLILDPMCTHSGSSNGGAIPARCKCSRSLCVFFRSIKDAAAQTSSSPRCSTRTPRRPPARSPGCQTARRCPRRTSSRPR